MNRINNMTKRILTAAAFLAAFQFANPAMATSQCLSQDCEMSGMVRVLGFSLGASGALTGTFVTPWVANSIADKQVPYWQLSLANLVVSTGTAAAVTLGAFGQFNEGQEGGYAALSFLAPVAASALTSWAMHAWLGEDPDKVAAADPYIPAVAMVVTPQEQSLMLGWQF
jgi:hypothetical protein